MPNKKNYTRLEDSPTEEEKIQKKKQKLMKKLESSGECSQSTLEAVQSAVGVSSQKHKVEVKMDKKQKEALMKLANRGEYTEHEVRMMAACSNLLASPKRKSPKGTGKKNSPRRSSSKESHKSFS